MALSLHMLLEGRAYLPHVPRTRRTASRFPRHLHGRHEEAHQKAEDRDHHQHFNERYARTFPKPRGLQHVR
jgi:hypothetical protein